MDLLLENKIGLLLLCSQLYFFNVQTFPKVIVLLESPSAAHTGLYSELVQSDSHFERSLFCLTVVFSLAGVHDISATAPVNYIILLLI